MRGRHLARKKGRVVKYYNWNYSTIISLVYIKPININSISQKSSFVLKHVLHPSELKS